jgi:predicted RNA methylase
LGSLSILFNLAEPPERYANITENAALKNNSAAVTEEMQLGQFIPLHYHFNMLRDQSRMAPFQQAIEKTVPEGGAVLELGGGTGVLSWFAAQKARQVWCVERNTDLVQAARSFLPQNVHGDRVTVVQADAMTYLPPEPVDVVICEMLHVGLIREKQVDVIRSFRDRYQRRFGSQLPKFIPDTSMLAVQPIHQNFCFSGYSARVPIFEPPGPHMKDQWLADPVFYSTVDYTADCPDEFAFDSEIVIQKDGYWNAVSFLTNNFLAFDLRHGQADQWLMNQLILPLAQPVNVSVGDRVNLQFAYRAGCSINALQESLKSGSRSHAMSSQTQQPHRRAA